MSAIASNNVHVDVTRGERDLNFGLNSTEPWMLNAAISNIISSAGLVILTYSKTCLKWPLKNRQNKDLNDKL